MVKAPLAGLVVGLFVFASLLLGDQLLLIAPVTQQTPVWCWLASSEMVLKYFGVGSLNPISYQCGLVAAFGGPYSSCWANCGNCMVPAGVFGGAEVITKLLTGYPEVARGYGVYGGRPLTVRYKYAALSSTEIQQNLDAREPIVAGISPSGYPSSSASEHVAVIVGYQVSSGRTYLRVNDPWPFYAFPNPDPYLDAGGVRTSPGQYLIDRDRFASSLVWRESWHGIHPSATTQSTYHVFPQFADGKLQAGTYYRSTLMISSPNFSSSLSCTFRIYGTTIDGRSTFTYNLGPSGWAVIQSPGTQTYQKSYGTLQCTAPVDASVLYSLYLPNGSKVAEATVFGSAGATEVQIPADQRGALLGLGIANDSDQQGNFTLTAITSTGQPLMSAPLALAPRSSQAKFLNEIMAVPENFFGSVVIQAQSGSASVIGLRYTDISFTTIPQTRRGSSGTTPDSYHVFPQYADGRMANGTYYKSTLMISNPSPGTSARCDLQLHGLSVNGRSSSTFNIGANPIIDISPGTQPFQSGYATLDCAGRVVEASVLYTLYNSSGIKLSEATVFSSPSGVFVQILGDERDGSRLGVAIANDSDQYGNFVLRTWNTQGQQVSARNLGLAAKTSRAAFLDELVDAGSEQFGQVTIEASTGSASMVGLRYTGNTFTTIPQTWRR